MDLFQILYEGRYPPRGALLLKFGEGGGGVYYGLVIVPRPPHLCSQTLHRSRDNLKNPFAYIFYM